jgi:uncharacterized protein YqgQ
MSEFVTIVSGLPRCGTSMMMRMLEAGGMELLVDHIRRPDEDNPKGYYELEVVKKIREDNAWLDGAAGKVFKMVSMLLYDLPADRHYKVIFMKRQIDEMLASQRKMLKRNGKSVDNYDNGEMKRLYGNHLVEIEKWLGEQRNLDVLYVNYNDTISDPRETAHGVISFLGNRLDIDAMLTVVDKSLYRQRKIAAPER